MPSKLGDFTVNVEFLTPNVIFPGLAPPGTFTTSCEEDWLTKDVTAFETPIKDTEDTRSRFVPVIVTLVIVSTGFGDRLVITGNNTSRSVADVV